MSVKEFNKKVTDNTVTSILHPKRYLRQRAEERAKLPPSKPYVPKSGPDKWIADAQQWVSEKINNVPDINITGESGYSKQLKERNPRYFPQTKKQEVKLQSKTQVSTPTKQEVKPTQKTTTPTKQATTVNNQKTTVKPKEEVKTTPKQTYLKPKGEVNMKVKLFQKMLLDEGFDLGKTADDGIWGAKTQAAFEKLQANKANYAIAMEKFKQLDEELQPKTIQAPQQFLSPRFAPASPATLPAFKKGGAMKKKSKKCSCGCAMKISKNAKGGLIESCACGCGMKHVNKAQKGTVLSYNKKTDTYNGRYKTIDLPYEQTDWENNPSNDIIVTAKKPLSTSEKKDKANKLRILPTPKVGVTVNKSQKVVK